MRFYDRTEELQDLREVMRQSFDDHSRLTVLTGRRRRICNPRGLRQGFAIL